MPKILINLVEKLKKNKKVKNPYAVAVSSLKKAGKITYSKKKKDWVEKPKKG